MKALLSGHTENVPSLAAWLDHCECEQVREASIAGSFSAEPLMSAVERNVLVQLNNLRSHPVVAQAMQARRLRLHGWVYDIPDGEVRKWSPQHARYIPLAGLSPAPVLSGHDSLCRTGQDPLMQAG